MSSQLAPDRSAPAQAISGLVTDAESQPRAGSKNPSRAAPSRRIDVRTLSLWILALCCCCPSFVSAEPSGSEPNHTVRLAQYRADRAAAVSFTFDDGILDQATLAVPLLAQHDIRATFFIIPGKTPAEPYKGQKKIDWPTLKQMAEAGHEIGNHTLNHLDLRHLDAKNLEKQVNGAQTMIEEKIGVRPFSFCYPKNLRTQQLRRFVEATHPATRERELFYGRTKHFTAEMANRWITDAIEDRKWVVPMIHGIEKGYSAFTSKSVLEDHLQFVSSQREHLWIDTFGAIYRYTRQKKYSSLRFRKLGREVTFTITCRLDPKLYQDPLTVIIPAKQPTNVKINGESALEGFPHEIRSDRILVDARPGSPPVTVTWDEGAEPSEEEEKPTTAPKQDQ